MNVPQSPSITLDTPIKRGDQVITTVDLHKPNSGALRGVALANLLQMDVESLALVVPRISAPPLTKHEVLAMDPADLLQIGSEVAGFLLPKASRPEASPAS